MWYHMLYHGGMDTIRVVMWGEWVFDIVTIMANKVHRQM